MTENFSRHTEMCANAFDEKGTTQLTDLLRNEFLDKSTPFHTPGASTKELDGGALTLSSAFKTDGKVDESVGMTASLKCDDGKGVSIGLSAGGKLQDIDLSINGQTTEHYRVLDIHRK